MEKRLEQIEELLRAAGAETNNDMIAALEDGALLARLGITDTGAMLDQLGIADTIDNREAVEEGIADIGAWLDQVGVADTIENRGAVEDLHARYIETKDAVEELHARYTAAVCIAQPTIDLAQNYMAPFSFGSTIRQVMEGFILWVQEQNLRA